MSMTASVRVEHKSKNAAGGQRRHDTREGGRIPEYVNRDRISENSIIIKPAAELELKHECIRRRALVHHVREPRFDMKVASVGIITFGTEAQEHINALPKAEQDRLYEKAARRVAEELGTTLTGLVVHRDESAPHAHFQMPAYALDGRPVSKHMDRAMCKNLQDLVGEVYNELGITRGKPRADRIRDKEPMVNYVHRSVRELHNDLPKELEAAREKVKRNELRYEKLQAKVEAGKADIKKVSHTMQIYIQRAQDAKAEIERLEKIGAGVPMEWSDPRPNIKPQTTEVVVGRELLGFKKTEMKNMVPAEKVKGAIETYNERETTHRVIIGKQLEEQQAMQKQLDLSMVKIRELEKTQAYYAALELKAEKVLEKTTELHNTEVDPIKKVKGKSSIESLIEMSEMRKIRVGGFTLTYNNDRIIWDGTKSREGQEKLPEEMVDLYQKISKNHEWSGLQLECADRDLRAGFRERYSDIQIVDKGLDLSKGERSRNVFDFEMPRERTRIRDVEMER